MGNPNHVGEKELLYLDELHVARDTGPTPFCAVVADIFPFLSFRQHSSSTFFWSVHPEVAQQQMILFLKNLAMTGGVRYIVVRRPQPA